ncbi:MAG: anti-sigma factor [Anaerolineae bacterium]|nr:anti-sigma factor [Anaerolineae bacterium]
MVRNEHSPYLENIAAYAVGALDAEEIAALESHLQTCASCRTELAEYRLLSESMLTAVPPRQPSVALRNRIQSRLPGARKDARPRWNWSPGFTAGALAFVVLLALNVYSVSQIRALQLQQTQLARQYQSGQTVLAMLSYPATERLPIASESLAGSFLLDKDRNLAALIVWKMPQLPEDQTYQIWLIAPQGDRTSAGIFRPEDGQAYTTQIIFPKQGFSNYVGIGVTVEPAGGSDQPTGERVLKVDF